MLGGLNVAIQSMRNAGIDEITARATDSAQRMDVLDHFQKREWYVWGDYHLNKHTMKELILHPSKKFGNDRLEVYDVILVQIQ